MAGGARAALGRAAAPVCGRGEWSGAPVARLPGERPRVVPGPRRRGPPAQGAVMPVAGRGAGRGTVVAAACVAAPAAASAPARLPAKPGSRCGCRLGRLCFRRFGRLCFRRFRRRCGLDGGPGKFAGRCGDGAPAGHEPLPGWARRGGARRDLGRWRLVAGGRWRVVAWRGGWRGIARHPLEGSWGHIGDWRWRGGLGRSRLVAWRGRWGLVAWHPLEGGWGHVGDRRWRGGRRWRLVAWRVRWRLGGWRLVARHPLERGCGRVGDRRWRRRLRGRHFGWDAAVDGRHRRRRIRPPGRAFLDLGATSVRGAAARCQPRHPARAALLRGERRQRHDRAGRDVGVRQCLVRVAEQPLEAGRADAQALRRNRRWLGPWGRRGRRCRRRCRWPGGK